MSEAVIPSKRGGARPGAGRPKGSITLKKVDPKVLNAGILPLEMRLRVARYLWGEATETAEDGEIKIKDLAKAKEAADFAEPALPYTSNRLATLMHVGPNGGAIEHDHKHEHSLVVAAVDAMIAEELVGPLEAKPN